MQNWKSMREGVAATSASYRELGFTILRMITGYGLGPNGTEGSMQHGSNTIKAGTAGYPHAFGAGAHGPPLGGLGKRGESGATNEQGAWCWREGCQGQSRHAEPRAPDLHPFPRTSHRLADTFNADTISLELNPPSFVPTSRRAKTTLASSLFALWRTCRMCKPDEGLAVHG